MSNPLAEQPRLHLQVSEVLRQQAAEAVHLARDVRRDPDLLDALEGMVARVRDTARTLGLSHVERAALRALRGLSSPERDEILEELLDTCTGGLRTTALLRPIVAVGTRDNTTALRASAAVLATAIRVVPDVATAIHTAMADDAGAVVAPVSAVPELASHCRAALRDRLLLVYGPDNDIGARLQAARIGAVQYLPEPLDLRAALREVRGRIAAWRTSAWRVLVGDRTEERAQCLAAAIGSEEIATLTAVGGFKLLEAIERHSPDLLVIGLPMDGIPGPDLAAMLRTHQRYSALPRMFVRDPDAPPPPIAGGHGVIDRDVRPEVFRARVFGLLDERRRERAMREHDELTGSLSQGAILNAADREVALARRRGDALVAVRFELDEPLELARRAGAIATDGAMRLLARTVGVCVRDTDSVGLIGSYGFLLLMPGFSLALARERVDGIRRRFGLQVAADERIAGAGFSVGMAEGPDDLLLRAERQLLKARGLVDRPPEADPFHVLLGGKEESGARRAEAPPLALAASVFTGDD
ncbi:MAG: GGDEF domain-containing protein [Deltaproteobacteria bacterium]|nr:GGDEF domain-containing protein [Deltaproteobacteria bacterium]